MSQDINTLYQKIIREHSRTPQKMGIPDTVSCSCRRDNSNCGDWIEIYFYLDNGAVKEAAFQGEGCALAIASADILCSLLVGMPVDAVPGLLQQLPEALAGDETAGELLPEAALPLLAVRGFPGRHGCVLLAWEAASKLPLS